MRLRVVVLLGTLLLGACTPRGLVEFLHPTCKDKDSFCEAKQAVSNEKDTTSWAHPIPDMGEKGGTHDPHP